MLAKNEARILKAPRAGGGGNYGRGNSGGGGNKSSGRKKGNFIGHSGAMDRNDHGIHPDAIEYEYGAPISLSFDLTTELVSSQDVLMGLNLENVDQWKLGVYMRMADPQGGKVAPIFSVTPEIRNLDDGVRRILQNDVGNTGGRLGNNGNGIGGNNPGQGNNPDPDSTGPADPDPEDPTEPEEPPPENENQEPPTLNFAGAAIITSTDVQTLDPNKVGTGFDIYLIDENGAAIIGPGTVYLIKTEAMAEQEAAVTKKMPNHLLARFDHATKKKKTYGKGGAKGSGGKVVSAKGMGYGSGSDGGMVIGTAPMIAVYDLHTDQEHYDVGESGEPTIVSVSYDIGDVDVAERRLKNSGNGVGNSGNGNSGNGNGNGGGNNSEPETTTTTATTTAEGRTTVDSTSGGTTTVDGMDATTTTPDYDGDIDVGDNSLEQPATIDPEDITKYSLGIYMRMANPQEGALEPIFSIPFCPNGGCDPKELESGEFAFSTDDLKMRENGLGFGVWILNGLGSGVAGPYNFEVDLAVPKVEVP